VPENPRIEELRRRVQADPASIAFAALAEEFRRVGRYEDAVETCRTGLQRHPAYLSARVTLGRALIEIGDYEAARDELETVLRSAPENLAAIRGLAQIHDHLGQSTEMHPDLHAIAEEQIRLVATPAPPPAPPAPPQRPAGVSLGSFGVGHTSAPVDKSPEPVDISAAALQKLPAPDPPPSMAFESATVAFEAPIAGVKARPVPHVAATLLRLKRFLGAIQASRHA
jgi:tetratricopeptide (TPR) repeat protein